MKKKSDLFSGIFEKGPCAASITSYCNVQVTLCVLPHLNRSVRRKLDFSIPKIIAPQRSKSNTFAYTEKEWFASADVYYITDISKKQDLQYPCLKTFFSK